MAPPLVGGLTPTTNTTAPIRHRLPNFFNEPSGTPVVSAPTADSFAATALHFLKSAQIDREDPLVDEASHAAAAGTAAAIAGARPRTVEPR